MVNMEYEAKEPSSYSRRLPYGNGFTMMFRK